MLNPALYQALETAARERISDHPLDVDRAVRTGLQHLRIRMLISYTVAIAAASALATAAITAHFALTPPQQLTSSPVPTVAPATEIPSTTSTPTTTETPTATSDPTSTTSSTVNVKPQTLTAISVSPSEVALARGSTQQLKATGTYSDGSARDITNAVDWTSDDPGIAAVDRGGLVTAVEGGSSRPSPRTQIRATMASRSVAAVITLMPHDLTGITIDPPSIQSCAGSYSLAAKGTYSDGTTADLTDVQWNTDNGDFASVSQRGQVTIKIPRLNRTLSALPRLNAVITATAAGQTGRAVVKCVSSETSTTSPRETPTTSAPASSAPPTAPPAATQATPIPVPTIPTTSSSAVPVPLR